MTLTHSQVLQVRNDLSPFLFHLTRTGPVTIRSDIFSQLKNDRIVNQTAKYRLEKILEAKVIRAVSSFGYFHYKVSIPRKSGFGVTNHGSNVKRHWLKSVCLTETPLDHIQIQMQSIVGRSLHFEPYGLAFKEEFIRSKGGNPVMYFDSGNSDIITSLDDMATSQDAPKFKSIMPLFEGFGPRLYGRGSPVDFRWEREWRAPNDIIFEFHDIAFGLCKSSEIDYFSGLVGNSIPFVDPVGDKNHLQSLKAHLRSFPHLLDLK
jgi:hypothetical protein